MGYDAVICGPLSLLTDDGLVRCHWVYITLIFVWSKTSMNISVSL